MQEESLITYLADNYKLKVIPKYTNILNMLVELVSTNMNGKKAVVIN